MDANGDLTHVYDAEDNVTEYAYDASHNLTSIKNPEGNVYWTNVYTSGKVTTVKYGTQSGGEAQSVTISYPTSSKTTETDRKERNLSSILRHLPREISVDRLCSLQPLGAHQG